MKLSKSLDLLLTFCISKVFSRPATLDLIIKNDADCPFFEPPVDVFGKRVKTPIPVKSKVIHCTHFSSPGFEARRWRRAAPTRRAELTQRVATFRLCGKSESVPEKTAFATPKTIIQRAD